MTRTDPNYMEALLQDLKVIDNNRRIVERLKKRIEEIKFKFEGVTMDGYAENVVDELQKILGEQK